MNRRVPNDDLNDNIYTVIIAFSVVWLIYFFSPVNHCSVYFAKK